MISKRNTKSKYFLTREQMKSNNWMLIYVSVFTLVVFCIYFYLGYKKPEYFACGDASDLIDADHLSLFQGDQLPEEQPEVGYHPIYNEFSPNVDGDINSDRSMYIFAYNKCRPECCNHSPYSCDRGCICLTQKQKGFLSSRGYNNRPRNCEKCKKECEDKPLIEDKPILNANPQV
jgi:hypothetical protein